MNWEIATAHHQGGRQEQEDRLAYFSSPYGDCHLLVIADGMGGHHGGRLASQAVIEVAQLLWHKQTAESISSPLQFLQNICEQAHQRINKVARRFNVNPHSTCVLLYIQNEEAWWAHLGDSRLYHFRQGQLLLRTKDHSIVQMLVELGRLEETDMARHPDQGRLLKWLGGDTFIQPEFGQARLQANDSLVLCTDGFWEQISPELMAEWLPKTTIHLRKIAKFLVAKALRAGGLTGDNVAVILARNTLPIKKNTVVRNIGDLMMGIVVMALVGWSLWHYSNTTLPAPSITTPLNDYGNVKTSWNPNLQIWQVPKSEDLDSNVGSKSESTRAAIVADHSSMSVAR